MEEATREHATKLESAMAEHKAKEDALVEERDSLREKKDAQIRQLEREKEEQRDIYEKRINELDLKLKSILDYYA